MNHASFVCERTVEFHLIPRLVRILRREFTLVIPVTPWLSREGSSFSRAKHSNVAFQAIGLYAKRPKIQRQSDVITIKVNDEFLLAAAEAHRCHIPMIAGCPLVKTIWEMN